jgi:hypothetical protein
LNSSVKTTVETGFSNTAPHRTGTAAHSTWSSLLLTRSRVLSLLSIAQSGSGKRTCTCAHAWFQQNNFGKKANVEMSSKRWNE